MLQLYLVRSVKIDRYYSLVIEFQMILCFLVTRREYIVFSLTTYCVTSALFSRDVNFIILYTRCIHRSRAI